ncbi:MAG: hypothetical protein OEM96_06575, partial [Gemmatimonadota bacterium]|nr:hypothetical protein [Gemmatimonadota bacterium]
MRNVPGGFDSHTLPWRTLAVAACLVLTKPVAVRAQVTEEPAVPAAAAPTVEDSTRSPVLRADEGLAEDTVRSGPTPMGAFFRSLILPGWGQFAADRPGRAVFYVTAQTATLYMVIRTQKRINRADDNGDTGLAESRREQREDWIVLAGFWALASAVDAWVSAHMWGFEGEVVPPPDGT